LIATAVAQLYLQRDRHHQLRDLEKLDIKTLVEVKGDEKSSIVGDGEYLNHWKPHRQDRFFEFQQEHPPRFEGEMRFNGPPPDREPRFKVIIFQDRVYILLPSERVFYTSREFHQSYLPIYIGLSLVIFLLFSYSFILKSIKPLQELEESIRRFGDGDKSIKLNISSNDEVGRISKEFDTAVKKITDLEKSRELFLRNIIHELKTPITKGKLVLALLQDSSYIDTLQRVFNRLDSLINEMANIEKLTSKSAELDFHPYQIGEILDHSIKLGFLEMSSIEIIGDVHRVVKVDLQLFSILCKNLIDNGIKYSNNKKIIIEIQPKRVSFISDGDMLEKEFNEYLKPFNHSQVTSQRGFGLGLYIANETLLRHNSHLHYMHTQNRNIFYFDLSSS
jgi:two-component system OmpR family sensor kinase